MSSLTPTNKTLDAAQALSACTAPIEIEKLVYEGWGLSRSPEGPVLFVPFSAPGDVVTLNTPYKTTKRAAFCTLKNIETPSKQRQTPVCEQFTHCGGCHWQHLSYPEQITWKQRVLQETFERMAKVTAPPLKAFIESPEPYRYRNHITWHVKNGLIGFHHWHEQGLVSSQNCHLVPEWLGALHQLISTHLKALPAPVQPQKIDVRWNESSEFVLLLSTHPETQSPQHKSTFKQLATNIAAEFNSLVGLVWDNGEHLQTLYGQPSLNINVTDIPFRVSTGAFFQGNTSILPAFAHAIQAAAQDAFSPSAPSLLDVYAGGGLFSRLFAEQHPTLRVLAVESHPIACEDFEVNLEALDNDMTLASDEAEAVLPRLEETFDVAIIDPPRAGCKQKVLEALTNIVQNRLIYVSCDPTTLARDTRLLLDTGHWQLVSIQGLDLFPQTYHIEAIAIFEKRR